MKLDVEDGPTVAGQIFSVVRSYDASMLSVNGFEVDALRISVDVTSHITQKSLIRMKGRVNLPLAMPYTDFTQPFDRIPELDNTRSWRTLGPPVSPTP